MDFRLINEQGITLVTTLLALVIVAITLPLLSFIINKLTEPKLYDDIKYEQFFHFIWDDVFRAKQVEAKDNTLVFELRTGEKATLALYENIIRRQVEFEGYEVYVRDVKSFRTEQTDDHINVKITSMKGDVYAKKIPIY